VSEIELEQFKKKEFNYLFVDIFNEGVDIPEIDTVLFYRKFDSFFKTIRTWIAFC
jgi:superfamily II DNA or RNA helicase